MWDPLRGVVSASCPHRVRIVWDGVNVAAAHILARFSTLIVHYNALLLCTSFRRCQSGNALINRLQGPDQKFGSGRPPLLSAKSLNGPCVEADALSLLAHLCHSRKPASRTGYWRERVHVRKQQSVHSNSPLAHAFHSFVS